MNMAEASFSRRRGAASAVSSMFAVSGLLFALCAHIAAPARAVTIELKDVAPDRVERQGKFAEGALPLPGTPDLSRFKERLDEAGVKLGTPVLLRVFKAESELEVWMRNGEGYKLFATYPICHWSGTLGPKIKEGDKQTPEGFYSVTRRQLHRIGRWPRSLNLGFPNAFDRAQARSGSYILVHGGCSSTGCFAMTNAVIEEIYGLTEAAIRGGQHHVPVHVFPFRMTEANLSKHSGSEWSAFWQTIRPGYDSFERTRRPPHVSVCDGRYQFTDAAPGEGGETSPLAVCGATDAAIRTLGRLARAAQVRPSLWPTSQASRLGTMGRSLQPLRTASSGLEILRLMTRAVADARQQRSSRPSEPRQSAGQHQASRLPTLECSLKRASCRKVAALRERQLLAGRNPTGRRVKTAASHSSPRR